MPPSLLKTRSCAANIDPENECDEQTRVRRYWIFPDPAVAVAGGGRVGGRRGWYIPGLLEQVSPRFVSGAATEAGARGEGVSRVGVGGRREIGRGVCRAVGQLAAVVPALPHACQGPFARR